MMFLYKILYGLVGGSTVAVIIILMYSIAKLEQLDLYNANAHYICRKKLKVMTRLKKFIHWLLSCGMLLTGHEILFLFNFPMLAWEVYEAFSIKADTEIFTLEEIKKQIGSYWNHVHFFSASLSVYIYFL